MSTCLLISGCITTTYIQGNISTSVDPSFSPSSADRIVLIPQDLDAVYYLPALKEALQLRGYRNVSISRSNKLSPSAYDISILLDVSRQIFEKKETVDDYGIVGTKVTPGDFKCKETNNELLGKRMRCRSGETEIENTYGITGTREVTTQTLNRSISLSFTSFSNNKSVVSAIGTSDVSDYTCSNAGIYKFLIIHTVKYLDFTKPRNTDYGVTLPEGYDCESSLEYERSLRDRVSTGQVASNTQRHAPQTKIDNSSVNGCVDGDCVNGHGTFTFANGDKYVGQWKGGKRNGQGTSTWARGDKYVGHFKDDKPNGQGTYTFSNGIKYVGQWKGGKRNGQGTSTYPNGDKYVGHYKDDKRNDQGTYTFAIGRKQEGQWIDGEFDEASLGDSSEDIIRYENGDVYIGEIKNGMAHGTGLLLYRIRSDSKSASLTGGYFYYCYAGDFKDGKKYGDGLHLHSGVMVSPVKNGAIDFGSAFSADEMIADVEKFGPILRWNDDKSRFVLCDGHYDERLQMWTL
mgnify:CR=1 FL=1